MESNPVTDSAEKINQQLEKYVGDLSLDEEKIQDILEDKIKELDAEISKINEKIQIETTNKNRKQELEKEIPLIQEEILELNEKIKNNELEISGKEATVSEKSNETKKKKSELQFETYAEAKQEFDFGKEKIEQIQKINITYVPINHHVYRCHCQRNECFLAVRYVACQSS